jgi:hypothetical protein
MDIFVAVKLIIRNEDSNPISRTETSAAATSQSQDLTILLDFVVVNSQKEVKE